MRKHFLANNWMFNNCRALPRALRDVVIAENSNSLTTLNVTITTDHGIPVTGLAKTDMYLYNTTDAAEITIVTAQDDDQLVF